MQMILDMIRHGVLCLTIFIRDIIGCKNKMPKDCPPGKILNPKTGRCVIEDGRTGKKVIAEAKKAAALAKKTPKKFVYKFSCPFAFYNNEDKQVKQTPSMLRKLKNDIAKEMKKLKGGLKEYIDDTDEVESIIVEAKTNSLIITVTASAECDEGLLGYEIEGQISDGWGESFEQAYTYNDANVRFDSMKMKKA